MSQIAEQELLEPLQSAPEGRVGGWAGRWGNPPPDLAVGTSPAEARALRAREIGQHVARELERGRPLYCIVRDEYIAERIGGFDGRALPASAGRGLVGAGVPR